jgi:hypothetical protein
MTDLVEVRTERMSVFIDGIQMTLLAVFWQGEGNACPRSVHMKPY